MTIKANHITLLRMILLPVPCYLLFGGSFERVMALVLFTFLGLTDYLDGYLARRHGETTLGTLLDPIADKIFITAIYIPFVRLQIVPLWMVLLLFIREYAVVEVRCIRAAMGRSSKSSELAKYKTNVQMMGAGFILLIEIMSDSSYVLIPLGVCLMLAVFPAALSWIRGRRVGARSAVATILIGAVFLARLLLPPKTAIWVIMAIIVAITLVSGIQYITMGWSEMRTYFRGRFNTLKWTSFLGAAVLFPFLYVSLSPNRAVAPWIIISILSLEFIARGVNNFLVIQMNRPDCIQNPWKTHLQNALGVLVLILTGVSSTEYSVLVSLILWIVLGVSLLYGLILSYVHRSRFMST